MTVTKKSQHLWVMGIVLVCCGIMGFIDGVVQPPYHIKSMIKIVLFLIAPLVYAGFDKNISLKKLVTPSKKGLPVAILLGVGTFGVIMGTYFLLRNVFDLSPITTALTEDMGVSKDHFFAVSIYISFVNSLLEEFFFRGFAFLTLVRLTSQKIAYLFSSFAFAGYHITMMIGWFSLPAFIIAMSGLMLGGFIFNRLNDKNENIYSSWMVHMFANFAINSIGMVLLGVI